MTDIKTNKVINKFNGNDQLIIAISKGKFTVNGKPCPTDKLRIDNNDGSMFLVNKNHYRGYLEIILAANKKNFSVVNVVPLEKYLSGTIGNEIPASWPLETIKAQTVAARTYVLYNLEKHKDDGYDVSATTNCQVYRGADSEDKRIIQAVKETNGLVMIYNDELINAFFHSSSGGYTENSENVWGTKIPYLRGVEDYDAETPNYSWQVKIPVKKFETALKSAGYNLGNLKSIKLSRLTDRPVSSPDRGVSGRVKEVIFTGTNKTISLTGNQMRSILDLNSTLFDIAILPTSKRADDPKKPPQVKNQPVPKGNALLPTDILEINGLGWGHGLGLSQWGAKVMAEKVPSSNTAYFKEILKHYYQGIVIQNIY
jgi:stage II sporulation protein D